MNWDAIQAVAELLSAIAVLVTLLYLAAQIRQNTRALRGTTLNAITTQTKDELKWAAEQMDLMLKASNSFAALSESEIGQVSTWLASALHARENEYFQYKLGLLDDNVWESRLLIIANIFASNWTVVVWRSRPQPYSSDFRKLIEEQIANGPYA